MALVASNQRFPERRVTDRFEILTWATAARADGSPAGKVLVTDISRGGFNMQSRWDFDAGENISLTFAGHGAMRAKIVWHDSDVGAFGGRFEVLLASATIGKILARCADASARNSGNDCVDRRQSNRFALRRSITARRNDDIVNQQVTLVDISMVGFLMRSDTRFDLKQTVYLELASGVMAEARIVRHDAENQEFGARFTFALAPALLNRVLADVERQLPQPG